jgi:hypothetical protein
MRTTALIMAFAALTLSGMAVAAPDWIAQLGVNSNSYPGGGNDPFNYFGAYSGETDDYLGVWDVVNPDPSDHMVDLIFRGDQYGNNASYPTGGLCWDIREPYDGFFKVWKIEVINPDVEYTFDVVYNYDGFGGYPLPAGWVCKLDMDGEINSGNYGNLSLYEVDLDHLSGTIMSGVPQTGASQTWYVIAGVPEPAFAQLAGLLVGVAGIGLVRFRK